MATAEQWLAKLTHLHVHQGKDGPAPHKPLLLLVLMDLADEGSLPREMLPLTPELAFRFATYWTIVAHRRHQIPDVRLPFHHLRYDGTWSSLQSDGQPSPGPDRTRYAAMSEDFLAAIREPAWRSKARRILIARYFEPAERVALYTAVGLPVPTEDEMKRDRTFKASDQAKDQGREARFRMTVVTAYQYACALTGLRLTTITAGSVVDAAHIHPFADSRNNAPQNGVALCKNAHWCFDQGLWSLSDDYRVLIGIDRFTEASPDGRTLASYHGQRLHLPADEGLRPNQVHLAWHRKKHGYG